jgi:hypothetical protein
MTNEELAAASLPAEPAVQNPEIAQPPEEHPSPAASESRSHEDGEVRTDDEDVGNVDADVKDMIRTRPTRPLPPSLVFGESKVTTNMIRDYEAAGFFPSGTGRAPLDEQTPTPEDGEVVVFRDFFTCGLRFPCDPVLPAVLDAFSVKIHQLSPTSFLEVSKFIWIMKTFGCNLSADAFARFFELVMCQMLSKSTTGNSTKLTMRVVLSTPDDRTPEEGSRKFRSRPVAKPISPQTGAHTGSMSRLTCLQFLGTKDRPILYPHLSKP